MAMMMELQSLTFTEHLLYDWVSAFELFNP